MKIGTIVRGEAVAFVGNRQLDVRLEGHGVGSQLNRQRLLVDCFEKAAPERADGRSIAAPI